MGSDFLTNKQLQTALEQNPELITWSSLREVILHRGKTGKLGFKVHTFKVIHLLPLFEPRREKTGLRGFRPGPTQTGLYKLRNELEA